MRETARRTSLVEQPVGQPSLGELDVGQGQLDAQRRVVAQGASLVHRSLGGGQRIPLTASQVVVVVLDRVEQMRHPPEQLADFPQRRLVFAGARPTPRYTRRLRRPRFRWAR